MRKWITRVFTVIFILGLIAMYYPTVSAAWNSAYQKYILSRYDNAASERLESGDTTYEYEYEKALAYNNALWPTPTPEGFTFLYGDDPEPEYMDCLNLAGDGIMGYLSIPKINVEIPVYHSTDSEDMNTGAGHLEGTSLPIGGENTHSVIAAHRGLPGHTLFTNLDLMETGDVFSLHVLGETLWYEVDQILVVEPEDVSALAIEEGKDLCTLVTCTPYGVNSHRLLVRGERVGIEDEAVITDEASVLTHENKTLIAALAATAAGLIIIFSGRHKKEETQ